MIGAFFQWFWTFFRTASALTIGKDKSHLERCLGCMGNASDYPNPCPLSYTKHRFLRPKVLSWCFWPGISIIHGVLCWWKESISRCKSQHIQEKALYSWKQRSTLLEITRQTCIVQNFFNFCMATVKIIGQHALKRFWRQLHDRLLGVD